MASALTDLRRKRRARRLGDTEWFDLAYRVYLAAFFGGSAIIILSDQVGDAELSAEGIAEVLARGPGFLGVVAMAALAAGLRSGSQGGPVTVESADVQHLLLAPVSRARVLRRPLWQRVRSVGFGAAIAGGVAGLLAEQRVPSSAGAWVWWGAVFGAAVGALFVAAATIAHAARVPSWAATTTGGTLLGWQTWTAATERRGPADGLGRVALRDVVGESTDLLALAAVALVLGVAHLVVGRLRSEQLARRGGLVSQLRFAVTMQDLRTVVLLRRQLGQERARTRPWIAAAAGGSARGGATGALLRRGVHGMLRTPGGRIGRMALLAALAGFAVGVAARGTTPALVACAILLFVLGLDLIEPLSQEIDHPDRTLGLPREPGWMHAGLLVGPALATVPFAMIGAAACTAVAPDSARAAFTLSVPIALCGVVGAAVSAVRDQHDPLRVDTRSYELVVPPEVAGFSDGVRMVWPVMVAAVGMLSVLAVRSRPDVGMVVRALIGLVLWLGVARWWIVHRTAVARRWREFAAGAT